MNKMKSRKIIHSPPCAFSPPNFKSSKWISLNHWDFTSGWLVYTLPTRAGDFGRRIWGIWRILKNLKIENLSNKLMEDFWLKISWRLVNDLVDFLWSRIKRKWIENRSKMERKWTGNESKRDFESKSKGFECKLPVMQRRERENLLANPKCWDKWKMLQTYKQKARSETITMYHDTWEVFQCGSVKTHTLRWTHKRLDAVLLAGAW